MEPNTDPSNVIRVAQLPFLVRLSMGLSMLCSWVLFEELIVDRTRLWALMPGYVRAHFCPWDVAAIGIIFVPLLLVKRWRRSVTT
jgi:hypothetical protein